MAPGNRFIDLKGKVFGALLVRCRGNDRVRPSCSKVPMWWCICRCGNIVEVEGGDLRGYRTVSCGCHSGNVSGHKNKTHGESRTKEYITWLGISRRCYDKKDRFYHNYGGRGITVCDRWKLSNINGLKNFLDDMGRMPDKDYSIERLDVNKGYSPDNCIWIPKKDQCKNKTTSRRFTYKGKTFIQSDWAKLLKVTPSRIQYHIWSGKSFTETVEFLSNKYNIEIDKEILCKK